MVSSVRYYSPKHINLKGRVPFFYLLTATLIFALIATYPPTVLLAIGIVYVLSGPVQMLLQRRKLL
jgi:CDP-diacylglycerol--serine O-phosphatidyltransferase